MSSTPRKLIRLLATALAAAINGPAGTWSRTAGAGFHFGKTGNDRQSTPHRARIQTTIRWLGAHDQAGEPRTLPVLSRANPAPR